MILVGHFNPKSYEGKHPLGFSRVAKLNANPNKDGGSIEEALESGTV